MTNWPNCKIVLLGKESTGKSCLVRRFTDGNFEPAGFASTVGTSFAAKKVDTSLGQIVINVWDTAGQERFDSLTRQYYNGASAALICVDLTDGSSFSKAQFWAKELKNFQPDCSCYIVVTKTDLLDQPKPALQQPAALTAIKSDTYEKLTEPRPESQNGRELSLSEATSSSHEVSTSLGKSSGSPSTLLDSRFSRCSDASQRGGSTDTCSTSSQSGSSSGLSATSTRRRKEVADSQVKALAQSIGAPILRTSSATGQGVAELFQGVAEDLAPSISKAETQEVGSHQDTQLDAKGLHLYNQVAREEPTGFVRRPSKSSKRHGTCCS